VTSSLSAAARISGDVVAISNFIGCHRRPEWHRQAPVSSSPPTHPPTSCSRSTTATPLQPGSASPQWRYRLLRIPSCRHPRSVAVGQPADAFRLGPQLPRRCTISSTSSSYGQSLTEDDLHLFASAAGTADRLGIVGSRQYCRRRQEKSGWGQRRFCLTWSVPRALRNRMPAGSLCNCCRLQRGSYHRCTYPSASASSRCRCSSGPGSPSRRCC
jgi:hypothetical protein